MPKQTKVCRICGTTYEACNSARTGDGTFRWKEVACSPECGSKYLKLIKKSRTKKTIKSKSKTEIVVEHNTILNNEIESAK